jgi:hypothetical protein
MVDWAEQQVIRGVKMSSKSKHLDKLGKPLLLNDNVLVSYNNRLHVGVIIRFYDFNPYDSSLIMQCTKERYALTIPCVNAIKIDTAI